MDILAHAEKLVYANRFPLIENLDDFNTAPKRGFESPLGIRLPPQVICGSREVQCAVGMATAAHRCGKWKNLSRFDRKNLLLRWASLLESHAEEIALMDCVQTGRSLSNFLEHSIPKGIEALRWFAELSDKTEDRSISEGHVSRHLTVIRREPLGVIAAIIPWNDPLVISIWKVAPALICGNAVIVKPSEYASYSLALAVRLAHEAGIPTGQLQLLTGESSTGSLLVCDPDIVGISFTGSSETGRWIAAESSRNRLKRVNLECGGKSAFLVSNFCRDIEAAAACLAKNAFYNQGQTCSAPTRAYVHSCVFDQFIERLKVEAIQYAPSHPINGSTKVGYMISRHAVNRVNEAISNAAKRGHRPILTAYSIDPDRCIFPSIFANISEDDELASQELFGPVLIVNRINSVAEGVARANNSRYGLAAGFWTDDLEEAMLVSATIEAGIVHINSYGEDGNSIPFGGTKDSGIGKEKCIDTLSSYSQVKSVCIKLSAGCEMK